MQQFLAKPFVQLIIALAALSILIAIAVYIVGRFRGSVVDDQATTADQLTKFREMHARGEVSDEEFREIKTQLASKLQTEFNQSDPAG